MAKWLKNSSQVPNILGSKHSAYTGCSKNLTAHPAANRYLILFRAGKGEGGAEEEWRPHLN